MTGCVRDKIWMSHRNIKWQPQWTRKQNKGVSCREYVTHKRLKRRVFILTKWITAKLTQNTIEIVFSYLISPFFLNNLPFQFSLNILIGLHFFLPFIFLLFLFFYFTLFLLFIYSYIESFLWKVVNALILK